MYEDPIIKPHFSKIREFFTPNNTSWIIFGLIILAGLIARFFVWDFTSSDMYVWKEAAKLFLSGENPYYTTLESFQTEGIKHFYAYFPLWLYICSLILVIFPESLFFVVLKALILLFDLQIVVLLYIILKPKIENFWRLKIPIAIWFITPIVFMTGSMHGKFDSLLFVFLLLACFINEKKQIIPESIFLSLAILTKPIALILVPFFFMEDLAKKNVYNISLRLIFLFMPILLFSIPFLYDPITYLQGVLGVHITRENDLGFIFSLLSLISSSQKSEMIIKIILTIIIILSWLLLITLSFIKKWDIYKSFFFAFLAFNSLYWVFLVQYTVWNYTLYVIVSTKSKLKHWKLGALTSSIVIISTVLLVILGTFVKHGQ